MARKGMETASPGLGGAGLGGLVVVTILVVVGLIYRGADLGAQPSGLPSSASSSAPPSADTAGTIVPSTAPTPLPSLALAGDTPGPDASIPTGQPLIVGITIPALLSAASDMGLSTCESTAGAFPGANGGYTMTCTGSAGTEDAAISLSAAYLTTDGVATVSVEASPSVAGGSIGDTQLGIRVLGPIAELTGGSAGSDWLVEKIDDETCDHGCFETFEDVKFEFYTAPDGSRSLHVTPTAMP